MAKRRAEFYFAVRGLLVRSELLDTTVEFCRDNFRVEILFPGERTSWGHEILGPVHVFYKKETFERGFAVESIKATVYGEGPRGKDADGSIRHLQKSFQIAETAVAELIEWARLHGQPWLGLHGQPVRRVGHHLLGDDSVDIADYCFDEDVLPETKEPVPEYEIEASLDAAITSSLAGHLGGTSAPSPIAETLLADALYFVGLDPPDYQRAVLIAAIACEVKVKDTLRQKSASDHKPLIELILGNPHDWSVAAVALFDKGMAAALGRSLKSDDREMYKDINRLFEIRNGIAHRGEKPEENEARRVVLAARKVFRWLDEP